jgi:polysaccharide biosynthesis protein VpsQ
MKSSNKGWVFAFWFYFGILITISASAYLKILPVKSSVIPFYDTIGHFVLVGLAAFFGHLALNKRRINCLNFSLPLAPSLVVICSGIDELLQRLSPNRSFDLTDLAANLIGILFFYWLAERWNLKKSSANITAR